jgi:hypothetical protein
MWASCLASNILLFIQPYCWAIHSNLSQYPAQTCLFFNGKEEVETTAKQQLSSSYSPPPHYSYFLEENTLHNNHSTIQEGHSSNSLSAMPILLTSMIAHLLGIF